MSQRKQTFIAQRLDGSTALAIKLSPGDFKTTETAIRLMDFERTKNRIEALPYTNDDVSDDELRQKEVLLYLEDKCLADLRHAQQMDDFDRIGLAKRALDALYCHPRGIPNVLSDMWEANKGNVAPPPNKTDLRRIAAAASIELQAAYDAMGLKKKNDALLEAAEICNNFGNYGEHVNEDMVEEWRSKTFDAKERQELRELGATRTPEDIRMLASAQLALISRPRTRLIPEAARASLNSRGRAGGV